MNRSIRVFMATQCRGGWVVAIAMALIAPASGCSSSRYGVTYDQRLPQLKKVAIVPASVELYSLHSGGVMEPRPDLTPQVSANLVASIDTVARQRGIEVQHAPAPASQPADGEAAGLALLAAVRDAIITHHYTDGKSLTFEYDTGKSASLVVPAAADAVLCAYLQGAIPTGGRNALKATATVVGVLTGIHFNVRTKQVVLCLMLIDRTTGKVLWFNKYEVDANAADEKSLRHAVDRACSYLLKPRN